MATLLATVITAAYFLVGCAILHQKGEVPSGIKVVEQLSQIYTETYGQWSYSIFMFGGFCTLFSTIVVVVAASGRMWTDLLSSMGVFQWEDSLFHRRLYIVPALVAGKPRDSCSDDAIDGHF